MLLKKLRPTTIIPTDLYVERAADRQLRSIIDDMGRPGYVLVARQMGKTNLLINMKRERNSDVVLYLDLSNRFDTVRAWFRNVIDSLIDAYPDLFQDMTKTILEQRLKSDFEPNVEYDRHLRLLLRSTRHRFVIVLDEIDSLLNAPYSDIIMAQIRSMYFSRATYAEYDRLTYVLSGVVEPSYLIKDKNISPFNIGEKIYLDDFSRTEFDTFLEKANLSMKIDVADAIFEWAQGNPRMTWDICSELEDRVLDGEIASKEMVAHIIDKLYLTDFDRAPIDHIRTLVESDYQIRDAIMSIRYDKSDFLDDKIKSRLYLSGITNLTLEGKVVIKNKIIDKALSDRWLLQIADQGLSLLKSASQNFIAEKFDIALTQYEKLFSDPSLATILKVPDRVEFGLSYFYTENMPKAIQEFRRCIAESDDPSTIQSMHYHIALAEFAQGHYQECLSSFEDTIKGPIEHLRLSAKLNMISAFLGLGSSFAQKAVDYGSLIIKELDTPEILENKNKLEFFVSALCNTAKANINIGDFVSAAKQLNSAMAVARPEFQHAILLFQYELPQSEIERGELVKNAANIVIDNTLNLPNRTDNLLQLNKSRLAINLTLLDKHGFALEFNRLARYIADFIFKKMPVAEVLLDLYESINSEEKRSVHIPLLERAMTSYYGEIEELSIRLKLLRSVCVYSNSPQINTWRTRYLEELSGQAQSGSIENDDFLALFLMASAMLRIKAFQQLRQLFGLWKSIEEKGLVNDAQYIILFCYLEMQFFTTLGKKVEAKTIATRLVALTDRTDTGGLQDDNMNKITQEIRTHALALAPRMPVIRDHFAKFKPNQKLTVRYGDSDIQEKKFKQIEKDLREGRCVIVNGV